MRPVLFDASVYISALRQGSDAILRARRIAGAPLWLSAVVLEELYAGAVTHGRAQVERLERDFNLVRRILVPNLGDWTRAGEVLGQIAAKYGFEQIGRGRLTNDALIAMSAARMGIRIITANEKDFRKLAEFRAFQWEVATV
jgi:predicted nucleic acid-binding protein